MLNEKELDFVTDSVTTENPMKEWLVNYVGDKIKPDNGGVTLQMIVDVMADEFPDFVLALAQENWLRGYQQALYDVDYSPPSTEPIPEE
jgi:hypothetical protein